MRRVPAWVWWSAGAVVGLMLAGILSGVLAWRWVIQSEPISPGSVVSAKEPDGPEPPPVLTDRILVVIMGVDERADDAGRSDTLMVASLDPQRREVALLSIPRDTFVHIPGHGYDKLNHAYAYGGHQLSIKTVSRLLDIPLEHYAIINFHGFERVVDALGGIDLEVEKRMYYVDPYQNLTIDLQPGMQHLDGQRALQYARFRADRQGDVGRIQRQQRVIQALVDKALQPSTALRIPALITSLFDTVRTDLSLTQVLKLATVGKEFAGDGIRTGILPGQDRTLGGIYYLVPDLVQVRADAYRLLIGQEPPADLLARAQEDHDRLAATVARQVEEDRRRAEELAQQQQEPPIADGEGADPVQDPESGGTAAPGQGETPSAPVEQDGETPGLPPEPGPAPGEGSGSQDPPSEGLQPGSVTAAVIDASGRNLLPKYVLDLKRRGIQVVRVGRSPTTESRTIIRDGSGNALAALELQAVFPWAQYEPAPLGGNPMVQVRIGTDAP